MNALTKEPTRENLSFSRRKRRSILASSIFRANRILPAILNKKKHLSVLLDLHRIFGRLAFECAGNQFGDSFHTRTKGLDERYLQSILDKDSTVIDIGCGVGRWSRIAAKYARSVTGIDFDRTLVEAARASTIETNVSFVVGNATDEFPANTYDLGIVSHVIEHIDDVNTFLTRLHSVTRQIVVEVPDFSADPLNRVRLEIGADFSSDRDHVQEYTSEILQVQLESNGWNVVSIYKNHGCIVCFAVQDDSPLISN